MNVCLVSIQVVKKKRKRQFTFDKINWRIKSEWLHTVLSRLL